MGCCCCFSSDFGPTRQAPSTPPSQHSSQAHRSFAQNAFGQAKKGYMCDICGTTVDPALFDGHQETCRTNHLRAILAKNAALLSHASIRPSSGTKVHDDNNSVGEKELCVVCMDQPRCYAFLPCGHISCCQECTKSLDQCPLCRQPREGLCHVSPNVTAQYECKHCHELIAPTLFDGHREVCGLRQRQKQREAELAAAAAAAAVASENAGSSERGAAEVTEGLPVDGAASGASSSTPQSTEKVSAAAVPLTPAPPTTAAPARTGARVRSNVCLECSKTYEQLVVCAPCGHRVLCYTCAQKRTTCPVCVSEIRDIVVAFD